MVAKVITVFNQKGGCGKTSISVQTAGTLGLRGYRVQLIDMDEQGTATKWIAQAESDPFPAVPSNLADMGGKMHRAVESQLNMFDYIIIDCPPAITSPAPTSAMLVSNLALIPVVPAPADLWAATAARQLALSAQQRNPGLKIRMVANMVQKRSVMTKDALDILADDEEVPLMEASLGARQAYRECQILGQTVHKVSGAKVAVQEVEALVDEIISIIAEEN